MSQAFEVVGPSSSATSTTLIEFILDETGSMQGARDATIGSFNEYINSQKAQPGTCLVSLSMFDERGAHNSVRTHYTDVSVHAVPTLTHKDYVPTGMTNMYDAIGARIHALNARAAHYQNAAKLVVIMTDGFDNSSKEYNAESLKALVKTKEAEGWTFVYLGANQDAWAVGQTFGISAGNSMSYSTDNMKGAMANLSGATTAMRAAYASGAAHAETAYKGFFNNVDKEGK